jgi:hypothetical protein
MPSHGVIDRGASAGEDSSILDVLLRDDAWLHDLSTMASPLSMTGNALWNGDDYQLAQYNHALGTDVFLFPLALWDSLLWHGLYDHLGLA